MKQKHSLVSFVSLFIPYNLDLSIHVPYLESRGWHSCMAMDTVMVDKMYHCVALANAKTKENRGLL